METKNQMDNRKQASSYTWIWT